MCYGNGSRKLPKEDLDHVAYSAKFSVFFFQNTSVYIRVAKHGDCDLSCFLL